MGKRPKPVFIGLLAKKTEKPPADLKNDVVEEICSVSGDISHWPKQFWNDIHRHNDHGLYDTEEAAIALATPEESKTSDIYAYKMYPIEFDEGSISEFPVFASISEDLTDFSLLGYDAANRFEKYFDCSPLSCNAGAEHFEVNRYCLFETYEYAYESTLIISQGGYEPGPYYIFEVYRKNRRRLS